MVREIKHKRGNTGRLHSKKILEERKIIDKDKKLN